MKMSTALLMDRLLRSRGWAIHSRPINGPVMWRKGSAVLPQEQALKIVMHEKNDGSQTADDATERRRP